ncbi:uncharacterized protein LTR77_003524 [Saxophila tyrrhenica]|uniref:Uncharacterized protein n=1 Tax=Saxophila tyrrhenica TaxID=1690608 RepID=A0AAV9PI35_9PEZI|nr:hypothetical protein LTR77_003524 [Saxophila tyrrhenica]
MTMQVRRSKHRKCWCTVYIRDLYDAFAAVVGSEARYNTRPMAGPGNLKADVYFNAVQKRPYGPKRLSDRARRRYGKAKWDIYIRRAHPEEKREEDGWDRGEYGFEEEDYEGHHYQDGDYDYDQGYYFDEDDYDKGDYDEEDEE